MRPIDPGYGDTPLSPDEADALLPQVRELLGEVPLRADIYALEQPILVEVTLQALEAVVSGELNVPSPEIAGDGAEGVNPRIGRIVLVLAAFVRCQASMMESMHDRGTRSVRRGLACSGEWSSSESPAMA